MSWQGDDGEGGTWEVAVYCDCFKEGLPYVAAVFVTCDDEEAGVKREVTALACASSQQAREMAGVLSVVAAHVDRENARAARPFPGAPGAPWGHKLTMYVYVEGDLERAMDVSDTLASIELPQAGFVGVALSVLEDKPRDPWLATLAVERPVARAPLGYLRRVVEWINQARRAP